MWLRVVSEANHSVAQHRTACLPGASVKIYSVKYDMTIRLGHELITFLTFSDAAKEHMLSHEIKRLKVGCIAY